ncbi:aldo/keto reductase (plasmid) [Streptomyces atratus]|uniref:Predicted oxidoreductase n=2 Tax=Streptomyces atratus TaxID=1893 RepID=A0A1K1ZS53_STRAR|nr:aldo/keto reductase [Streptomyces atratus]SFX76959.1 Predicted oxidoreductase [Streptomyces atratus]
MRRVLIDDDSKEIRVGLGCTSLSHGYSPVQQDEEDSVRVIHRALELGIRIFDTADIYGPYSNERLLGRALRKHRDRAVIATKCGLVTNADGTLSRDGSPQHIQAACEASLTRLRTDVIDLYQLHRVDPKVPLEETWGAMAALVQAGKVRSLGVSHASIEELDRIHAQFPIGAVQYELSILARHTLEDVLQWCEKTDTPFLAFSPLGRGFLTGQVDYAALGDKDARSRDPRFDEQAFTANRTIVDGLTKVSRRHGATPAQVSIAWVLAQSDLVIPIPATKRLRWLEQNAAAAKLELGDEDLRELARLPEVVGRMRWDYARTSS